jgi:hypothetical protein
VRIRDDADDRHPLTARRQRPVFDPAPERILAGPEHPRHRLVDDHGPGRPGGISLIEKPAGAQRNLEHAEIVRRNRVDRHLDAFLGLELRPFRDAEVCRVRCRAEKNGADGGCALCARQRGGPLDQTPHGLGGCGILAVTITCQ